MGNNVCAHSRARVTDRPRPLLCSFITCGPNWPTIHNSLLPLFEEVIDQIFYEIQRIQVYNLHSIEPRADVVAKQMAECQEYLKNTVSYDRCNAWYKARDGVRVSGVWPGDTASFIETMRNVPKEELVWRAWRDGKVVEIPASEIVL